MHACEVQGGQRCRSREGAWSVGVQTSGGQGGLAEGGVHA